MPKSKEIYSVFGAGEKGHFFASSAAEWKTSHDVREVINHMEKDTFGYNLFFVPLPASAEYKISQFQPVVDGLVYLGFYQPRKAGKQPE